MSAKSYFTFSGVLFSVITAAHLLRVIFAWEANIGGWEVPMWLSVLAVVVLGYLTYSALKLMK